MDISKLAKVKDAKVKLHELLKELDKMDDDATFSMSTNDGTGWGMYIPVGLDEVKVTTNEKAGVIWVQIG